jgi:hypothetical protein
LPARPSSIFISSEQPSAAPTFFGATFIGYASFDHSSLTDGPNFHGAIFSDSVSFEWASFRGYETAIAHAYPVNVFDEAAFAGGASFRGTTFDEGASCGGARVLQLDNPGLNGPGTREWPDGWTVRPDPNDPTRGTLVWSGGKQGRSVVFPSTAPGP